MNSVSSYFNLNNEKRQSKRRLRGKSKRFWKVLTPLSIFERRQIIELKDVRKTLLDVRLVKRQKTSSNVNSVSLHQFPRPFSHF